MPSKAPPPMPDTSKIKGCGFTALALLVAALAVPTALVSAAVRLFS